MKTALGLRSRQAGSGSGDDIWTKETDAVQHLDMSAQAGAAGTKTARAYKANFGGRAGRASTL